MKNSLSRPTLLALLLPAILGPVEAGAQSTPTTVTYQGRLTDNSPQQNPVDGTANMAFEIWDVPVGGTATPNRLWVEPATGTIPVTVSKGIFSVVLGANGVPVTPSLFAGGTAKYLQIVVEGETLAPRQVLTSVGWAHQAAKASAAETVTDGVVTTGSYVDPSWISSLSGSKISGTVGNCDQLDGNDSTAFAAEVHPHSGADITVGAVDEARLDDAWTTKGFAATTLQATSTAAASLDVAGGIEAGTGNVGIVNSAGKIPAISSTYFASLDGANLTNVTFYPRRPMESIVSLPFPGAAGGAHLAATIGPDGFPFIAGFDGTGLRVFHCEDPVCSGYSTSLIETGTVQWISVVIGVDGGPVISYYGGAQNLKVAWLSSVLATTATKTALDIAGDVGLYTSIAIGTDGLPIISYHAASNTAVRVAHCNDAPCTSATIQQLPGGRYSSIAICSDGRAAVVHHDGGQLSWARCTNVACSGLTPTPLLTATFEATALAIGADGLPIFAYRDPSNGTLFAAHCSDALCSGIGAGVTGSTLDATPGISAGQGVSIGIGTDGLAIVSYYDATNTALKIAKCRDLVCSSAYNITFDNAADVGRSTAMLIGMDGMPLVVYYDATNQALKVARMANRLGLPKVMQR